MQEPLFVLLGGLVGTEPNSSVRLGEQTYNVYPDSLQEGYLVNYPGKTDIFFRIDGANPEYGQRGVPPVTTGDTTRLLVFRDRMNQEHIVFVMDSQLCVVVGNSFEVLYTFVGRAYDGKYFPELFIHEGLLIILNFGDPPLLWDGETKVHPLGVHETPMSPEVRPSYAPGSKQSVDYGYWAWYNTWWVGKSPQSWPANNVDASDNKIPGIYQVRMQFIDRYGNRGKAGPPSRIFKVAPRDAGIAGPSGTDATKFNADEYVCVDWHPPKVEDHIYGYELGRTTNMHGEDPQGGPTVSGLYWTEYVQSGMFPTRLVCQISDTMLLAASQMDIQVLPPTQSSIGCSWSGRIVLAGHADPTRVTWSDPSKFGQFRASQEYNAKDHVKAVVPLEGGPQARQFSKVAVITRSSVETLYENAGIVGILSQDFANGSRYGRSIVPVDGGLFGLWNDGFAFYDGQKFTRAPSPYFISDKYLDDRHFVYSARMVGRWYYLTVRKDSSSDENNNVLMFNIDTAQWYIIKEAVYDIAEWRGAVLGCNDSIYEMFKGEYTSDSVIDIPSLVPQGSSPGSERVLDDINVLLEPSTVSQVDVEILAQSFDESVADSRSMVPHSSMQRTGYSGTDYPNPHWNQPNLAYDQEPAWNAENDLWVRVDMSEPITGTTHSIKMTLPSGNRIRMKGIRLLFSQDRRES